MSQGIFDDLPAENFGNLPPLPDGYVVVYAPLREQFYWTIRGTDVEGWGGWDRYAARRAAIAHHKTQTSLSAPDNGGSDA